MAWFLVKIFSNKKIDIFIIILCSIFLIVLLSLHNYLLSNKNISSSRIIIISNKKITDNYKLNVKYYLLYDDVNVGFNNVSFYLLNDYFLSFDIIDGRSIENDFEMLVPEIYKGLLNKRVVIKINNINYVFLIVGIYKNNNFVNNRYFYTDERTLDILSEYSFGEYRYVFMVDNYDTLNKNIDLLRRDGYNLSISNNDTLVNINNYNTINDVIMLFIVVLSSVVLIFTIHMIF